MQDAVLMERMKTAEDSCEWFLREHTDEKDTTKCSKGLVLVAKALRALLIVLEQEGDGEVLETPILSAEMKCAGHSHVTALCFSSKGEFYFRAELHEGRNHLPLFGKKVTPTELVTNIPARQLVT